MSNLNNCLLKHARALKDFDKSEVIEAAKVYQSRGETEDAANVAAIEDHLRELEAERERIEGDILAQWKKADPKGYAKAEKMAAKAKTADPMIAIREFYTPGNIIHVDYWNQQDKVLAFDEKAPGNWSVTVQQVKKQGDVWVPAGQVRQHMTTPGKDRIVDRVSESVADPDKAAAGQADADFDDALGELGDIIGKNFRATFTPEQEQKLIPVLTKLFDAAFRKGYYSFKSAAKFVLDAIRSKLGADVADQITIDHLQGAYIGMAGRYKDQGADKPATVAAVESVDEITASSTIEIGGIDNGPDQRSSTDLERDSEDADPEDGVGAQGVRDERRGDVGTGEPGISGTEAEGRAGRSGSLFGPEAPAAGEPGDQSIYTGAGRPVVEAGASGSGVDSGSDSDSLDGSPIEPTSTDLFAELAESRVSLDEAKAKQQAADRIEHKPGLENIRETLPILTEGQQEDVHIAETRFAVPDGYGMLFTNGTGTGKTFTGLGIIKRMAVAGKRNIIIAVPNDKIADDWRKSGKLLGLDISLLENTKDAGRGIVITTYANFGQNPELARREWDLVVADEAHKLAMNASGEATLALDALQALTLHPDGVYTRARMLHADLYARLADLEDLAKSQRNSDDERNWHAESGTQTKIKALHREIEAKVDAIKADVAVRQGAQRPRALFLSATPFAYEKTVDWANGYLFDYNEGRGDERNEFRGYNEGSNHDQFFMQHFGYRMRYGKLTEPDSKVDRGLMQRQFNGWLKKRGALAGRMLDVKADYDRRFILTESAIGTRIDEALEWFEVKRKAGDERRALWDLREKIGEKFDYLSRRYLLEAIKAQEVIPHVREHLALGRKVVVFHDYKKGGGFNPFNVQPRSQGDEGSADIAEYNAVVDEFRSAFKDLIDSDVWRASSPITAFQQAFPNVLLFNGNVPKAQRRAAVEKFQDDASGPQVILVQSDAGKEGISLHDTTGAHQRVLFNLGQPTAPTTAIQQEGRIYRTGQVTDAIFRYLNTGTDWEKWAFATTIAQRASAAENLGMGEQARALKDAFIAGFEESDDYRAGMDGEGKGGKERDRAANEAITEYDRARAFYFGTQKKTSKTKAQEGVDYFATPEPVGFKMMEWADIRPGESVLEPSAGHGAIARWMPDTAVRTAIEPSMTLRSRLAMVFDGTMLDHDFEDLNIVNKYDAIVMNPPFGSGGKTAIEHVAKAARHLRDGGRIVALIPRGPAADKRFDKWFYEEDTRPAKPLYTHPEHGPIYENDTLTMAHFGSDLKIAGPLAIDKDGGAAYVRPKGEPKSTGVNLVALNSIQPGKRTESYKPAEGLNLVADVVMPNVTFERAGTQVATRIVVIEKSPNAPQQFSPSFTDVEDINELFDRMEGLTIAGRAKPEVMEVEVAPAKPGKAAKPVVDQEAAKAAAETMGLEIVEHVTQKGKTLRGVVRTDLTRDQAKEIDEFTFKKDGGWFIREKHLVAKSNGGTLNTEDSGVAMYSKSRRMTGDSGLGDVTITPTKSLPNIAKILASEGAQQVTVKGGNVDELNRVAESFGKRIIWFQDLQGAAAASVATAGLQDEGLGIQPGRTGDGTLTGGNEGRDGVPGAERQGGGGFITNGFVNTGLPEIVFLNAHGSNHVLYILGHELGHTLKIDDRKLWAETAYQLQPLIRQFGKYRAENGQRLDSDIDVLEEIIGDMIGDNFLNQGFWEEIANTNKSLFSRMADAAIQLLNKAISIVVGRDIQVFVTDLRQARAVIAQTMMQYAENQAKGMYAANAKQLDQDYINKRMTAWHGGLIKAGDIQDMVLHSLKVAAGKNQSESSRGMVPAMASKVGAGGAAFRVVDLFGNGSRVQHFDDKRGLFYEAQKYPSGRTGWRAGEVVDGMDHWLSDKEFGSMEEAQSSVRGLRISNAAKQRNADKYGSIPTLWTGEARRAAKAIIDAGLDVERFSQSTQSKSKYVYLGNGLSIRLADHALPGAYEQPDVDYRYGGDIRALVEEIKEGAPTPDSGELGSRSLSNQDAGAVGLRADESGQLTEPAQSGSGAGSNTMLSEKVGAGNTASRGMESRQSRQQALPNTGATPPAPPTRQTPMGLQGGAPGNNASWNGYQATKLDDVIRTLQDKHIDSKRTVQAIKAAGRQVADKWDVYLQESLFHGRAAKRTLEFVETELTPLAQDLAMRGLTLDELDQYLHARHAEEANALIAQRNPAIPDGGSGMTNQQALDYFTNLDPSKRKRLEASAARVDAIIAKTRQTYVAYGLESQETIDGWADTFDHYVPLMREDKDGAMGIGQGFSIKGKESKARTGSTRAVVDIMANIAMQRERAIVRGEKNRVSVSLLGLAKLNPNTDFWMTDRIPMITGLNPATGLVETYRDPIYKSRENVVVAKVPDGKGGVQERAVVFNEENEQAMFMARALKNLDVAQLEGLMGAASRVTRYFASINTQYNPVFGVTNLVRDVQDAMLNLSSTPIAGHKADVLKHTLGALRGIYIDTRQMRKGQPATSAYAQLWEEFQHEGGQTGYRDMFRTSADRARAIEKAINPTQWMNSTLGQIFTAGGALRVPVAVAQQKATWLFDWLSDYNESMENAVRLAAYKVGLEQGMSRQQAAAMAKSLTVNFNRKGQIGMQAGALYAFFNASMQGTGRIAQTLFTIQGNDIKTARLSKAGQKIVAGGILLGSLQALMLMAAGFGEDEPPEFVRERNTIIPIGNKKYVTIPMPLGFAVLPNIGRIATEFVMGGFKNPAKHVTRLIGIAADAFNPIGGNGTVLQMVTPTALDPLAAIAENKDWTKKPIAKVAYDKATPGHQLWKDTASTPSKLIAEAINTMSGGTKHVAGALSPTPDQIDYLFGQVTGGVGRELSKSEQSIMATVRGEDLPPHKIPLVGRFYGDAGAQSSQASTFYTNINRINEYEAEIKGLRKEGKGAEAAKFITEHPEARMVMRANYAEKQVQKLRKEKRDLVEKDAPRDRIKLLENRIKAEMQRFNDAVKASKQRVKEAA